MIQCQTSKHHYFYHQKFLHFVCANRSTDLLMPHTSKHTTKRRRGSSTSPNKDQRPLREAQGEESKTNQNPGPSSSLDAAWVGHMLREQQKRTTRQLEELRAEMLVLVESNASRNTPSNPTPTPEVCMTPLVPSDHPLAAFICDMLIQEDWERARCGDVRAAYTKWASDHPLHKLWNHINFAKEMSSWFPRCKSIKHREYTGVGLISRTGATLDIADRSPAFGGKTEKNITHVPVLLRQTSSAVVCASQSENTAEPQSPHLEEMDPESSSVTTAELPQCADDDEQVSDDCSDFDGSGAPGDCPSDDADEQDCID
jgi:hypothetical protein